MFVPPPATLVMLADPEEPAAITMLLAMVAVLTLVRIPAELVPEVSPMVKVPVPKAAALVARIVPLLTVVPAVLFWNNTWLLMGFCCLFVISYVSAYLAIVRFKVPSWLRH